MREGGSWAGMEVGKLMEEEVWSTEGALFKVL